MILAKSGCKSVTIYVVNMRIIVNMRIRKDIRNIRKIDQLRKMVLEVHFCIPTMEASVLYFDALIRKRYVINDFK